MERDSLSSTGDSCELRVFCCPTMPSHQRYFEILQSPRLCLVQDDPPPVCRKVSTKSSCRTGPRVPPSSSCWEEPFGGNSPRRAQCCLPPLWQPLTFKNTQKMNLFAGFLIQIYILSLVEVASLCQSGLIHPRNKIQQLPSDVNLGLKAFLLPSHTIWELGFSIFC